MDTMKHISRLTPNLMKLTLNIRMSDPLDNDDGVKIANEFISSWFSVTKLNQLIVKFTPWTWTQQHIDTF